MPRRPWGERFYRSSRRLLRRLRLQRVLDFRGYTILVSDHAGLPPSRWEEDGWWLGEVQAAQTAWLAELQPQRAAELPERWEAGLRCFAAALDQRCVGFLWVAVGPRQVAGKSHRNLWDLPAAAAWLFDAYVHPLVLGTYPDLERYAAQRLRREGILWMFGQVEFDNPRSRRVHQMLGGAMVGWVATLSLAGLRLHLDHAGQQWRWRWGNSPAQLAAFLPRQAEVRVETASAP